MNISHPPIHVHFDSENGPNREWLEWMSDVRRHLAKQKGHGTTTDRPKNGVIAGDTYFDTTLGKPIWYSGSGWVDATGSSV